MTLVSANFNKYRAWTFLFGAVCILIMPLVMFMMWWLRDFPLGSASFLVYFLAPFALGMTVSQVELTTMRAPMVWCLPNHLQSVRTLLMRVGLLAFAPILLCLSQRETPLSAMQFASISFANLFFYCLGLIPRIFPASLPGIGQRWFWPGWASPTCRKAPRRLCWRISSLRCQFP